MAATAKVDSYCSPLGPGRQAGKTPFYMGRKMVVFHGI